MDTKRRPRFANPGEPVAWHKRPKEHPQSVIDEGLLAPDLPECEIGVTLRKAYSFGAQKISHA
jgi:hypothetical protein